MADINARRGKGNGAGSSASPPDHGTEPALASEPTRALTWAIARVDRAPETQRHRENRGGDQNGDQFADGQISNGGDRTAAFAETLDEGRAA
jgi:hypothetical protein